MEHSTISWTDNTFNPWMGCTKVSPGCERCYAKELTTDRLGLFVWGPSAPRQITGDDNWRKPVRWDRAAARNGSRVKVFCASLCDVFEDHPVANAARQKLWDVIRRCTNLDWQLLTKRPERIASNLPADWGLQGWPHVWIGTSIENDDYVWRADHLRQIPAAVRFISYEPALGPLDQLDLNGIDWLIYGGESGQNFREHDLAWPRSVRDRCAAAGVAFFYKQSPGRRSGTQPILDGQTIHEFPKPRVITDVVAIEKGKTIIFTTSPAIDQASATSGLSALTDVAARADQRKVAQLGHQDAQDSHDASSIATPKRDLVGRTAAATSDFPSPASLDFDEEFIFEEDDSPVDVYRAFARRLNQSGDLYRAPSYAGGLLLASSNANMAPVAITKGNQLVAIALDRVPMQVVRGGKVIGRRLPASHANTMLASEVFLQVFAPVDAVVRAPVYQPDFQLTAPGYNDGGRGRRVLHVGPAAQIENTTEIIDQFLDVMAFASNADRTNAVAAALTCLLRGHFPGAKPLILATATKSHAGKDTIIHFAAGTTPTTAVSYQATDWALERSIVGALKHNQETGVVVVDNARLGRGSFIASGFLERFLTDPEPLLFSTGSGGPVRRKNDIVLAFSTNFGVVSEDLMNRSLPIHLAPAGNVADRQSPIGNPKMEYLPRNRARIQASLMGMIERWKKESQPRDMSTRHTFTEWAAIVGGILQVNGFTDFLANYNLRRTADDPIRRGLGLLGSAMPSMWLRSSDWAQLVASIGLVKLLIPEADRDGDEARARGIGVVLSAHVDETFSIETDDERLTLTLEKARRRFDNGKPSTRYRFSVVNNQPIPVDAANQDIEQCIS